MAVATAGHKVPNRAQIYKLIFWAYVNANKEKIAEIAWF